MATTSPLAVAKANIETQLSALQSKLDEVEARRNELLSEKSELEGQLTRLMSAFPDLEAASPPVVYQQTVASPKKTRKTRVRGGKSNANAMLDSMKRVIGDQTMTASEVSNALTAAGLAPASKNLTAYVSSVFSASEDDRGEKIFVRESRGHYRVAPSQRVVTTPASPKVETANTPVAEDTSPAERLLNEVGLDSASLGVPSPA